MNKKIALIGASLGWGAQRLETENGPKTLQNYHLAEHLNQDGAQCYWRNFVTPPVLASELGVRPYQDRIPWIAEMNHKLANELSSTLEEKEFPVVVGGDHSIAIGTWSGVVERLNAQGEFGLMWVDAHMDANTPETTPSHAIHGMPLAVLLGYGLDELINVHGKGAKLNPKHVTLICVRSYEEGEALLLKSLGVKIFYMEDIKQRGLAKVFEEAQAIVKSAPKGFGISIDLDAFDPAEAPGVGSPVEDGLHASEFLPLLNSLTRDPKFQALEVAEYNPALDYNFRTAALTEQLIRSAAGI